LCKELCLTVGKFFCTIISMKQEYTAQAPARIITQEDRLRWVIRFAQMDLDTLRPGDWVNLRDDIHLFAYLSPNGGCYELPGKFRIVQDPQSGEQSIRRESPAITYGIRSMLDGDTAVLTDEDIRAIQPQVLAWLRALTATPDTREWQSRDFVPFHGRVAMDIGGTPVVIGTACELFWWHLLTLLLAEQPGHHILRCPECDTIFYRVQKQAYCSRTCGNRVTQRRWRERQEASAAQG
jgi:hypothetical protein